MIAITGGGTGGHLSIAKVVMKELNKHSIKPIYIGSTYGQDKEWFENEDGFSEKYFLDSKGVVNQKGVKKITSFLNILFLSKEANSILKKHSIKKVFSVGGFSAAPASISSIFNRELYIHEQNAYIGLLNRTLKPFSKRFFNTFLYNDPYPVDKSFIKNSRIRKNLKTVIFLGGSQGAVAINNIAIRLAPKLIKNGIRIIHQTGNYDFERVKKFYKTNNLDVDFFKFDKEIYKKISLADLAISRAGASTLFELAVNYIPTLFLPYPYAANNHQYYNAKFLVDKEAAYIIDENLSFDFIKNIDLEKISVNLSNLNLNTDIEAIIKEII